MTRKATIVYVSEFPPVQTQATYVVMYRHLRSLEDLGFRILVVTLHGTVPPAQIRSSWEYIFLPSRKLYYPPYRPHYLLRGIRWLLLDRIVMRVLRRRNIYCLIGLLQAEYLVGYAAWLSRRLSKPLFYFYHDRGERLAYSRNPAAADRMRRYNIKLLSSRNVLRVWTVSSELTYSEPSVSHKFRTVYPLPDTILLAKAPEWRSDFARRPVLAHCGSLYAEIVPQIELLAQALRLNGGRLLLSSHLESTARSLEAKFPEVVRYLGDIPDVRQLFELLSREATAFVVIYPQDLGAMPWSLDCFPSKLVQLVHTGLPGLVFAPGETSLGKWCSRTGWTLYTPTVDFPSMARLVEAVRGETTWTQAACDSRRAALQDFSPSFIEDAVNQDVISIGNRSVSY